MSVLSKVNDVTVDKNSQKETVCAKTDRITVIQRGWDVAGPESNQLVLGQLQLPEYPLPAHLCVRNNIL